MYPFNRTTSIRAESAVSDEEDEEEEEEAEEKDRNENENMYQNRHIQFNESCQIIQNNNAQPPASPVEKTILASILELSNINDKWSKTFTTADNRDRSGSIFECSWR